MEKKENEKKSLGLCRIWYWCSCLAIGLPPVCIHKWVHTKSDRSSCIKSKLRENFKQSLSSPSLHSGNSCVKSLLLLDSWSQKVTKTGSHSLLIRTPDPPPMESCGGRGFWTLFHDPTSTLFETYCCLHFVDCVVLNKGDWSCIYSISPICTYCTILVHKQII